MPKLKIWRREDEQTPEKYASWLTPQFQDHLKDIGWPPDLADKLSVRHTDKYIRPHFSGTDEEYEQVQDLEFGTPDIPPSGAIFGFIESHQIKGKKSDYSVEKAFNKLLDIFR